MPSCSLCLTWCRFVLLGHQLTPEIVFTSLALFNVLIAPLNSLPWVLNGVVEAFVSVRRLQRFLMAWESKADWAYAADNQVCPCLCMVCGGTVCMQKVHRDNPQSSSNGHG